MIILRKSLRVLSSELSQLLRVEPVSFAQWTQYILVSLILSLYSSSGFSRAATMSETFYLCIRLVESFVKLRNVPCTSSGKARGRWTEEEGGYISSWLPSAAKRLCAVADSQLLCLYASCPSVGLSSSPFYPTVFHSFGLTDAFSCYLFIWPLFVSIFFGYMHERLFVCTLESESCSPWSSRGPPFPEGGKTLFVDLPFGFGDFHATGDFRTLW